MDTQTLYVWMVISVIIFGFYGALIYRVRFLTKKTALIEKTISPSAIDYLSIISMDDLTKRHFEQAEYEYRYLAFRKMSHYFAYFTFFLLLLFVISVVNYQFLAV